MYYVYLLRSDKDQDFYIGFTTDIERRLAEHNDGRVDSTSVRRPLSMVYYEAYTEEAKARERERKLKGFGSAYQALLKRLGYK